MKNNRVISLPILPVKTSLPKRRENGIAQMREPDENWRVGTSKEICKECIHASEGAQGWCSARMGVEDALALACPGSASSIWEEKTLACRPSRLLAST